MHYLGAALALGFRLCSIMCSALPGVRPKRSYAYEEWKHSLNSSRVHLVGVMRVPRVQPKPRCPAERPLRDCPTRAHPYICHEPAGSGVLADAAYQGLDPNAAAFIKIEEY